jgi:putative transcriptional regulator
VPSRSGQFLIASSALRDPNFARSIVLIVKDDDKGTFGLVINRPSETTVKEACSAALETTCEIEQPLYIGGPCEGLFSVIHGDRDLGEVEVLPGIFFTAEGGKVERLIADNPQPAKHFAGYAGWSAGQLDAEMETGAWLLTPADQSHIFMPDDELWSRVMTQLTVGKWVDVDEMPEDPSVN